jgi:hypothetical protein
VQFGETLSGMPLGANVWKIHIIAKLLQKFTSFYLTGDFLYFAGQQKPKNGVFYMFLTLKFCENIRISIEEKRKFYYLNIAPKIKKSGLF